MGDGAAGGKWLREMVPPLPGPLLHSVEERGNIGRGRKCKPLSLVLSPWHGERSPVPLKGGLAGRQSVQVGSDFGEQHLLNEKDAALDNDPLFGGGNYGLRAALL